jgi:RimJ/RimL family protein N-acetyltransferase
LKLIEIRIGRLALFPLTDKQLRLYLADPELLERELGFPVSRSIISKPVRRAIGKKLTEMSEAAVADHLWYTYWLIVVDEGSAGSFGAGLAGFKGMPDSRGLVEIGYGIDQAYRNKGYVTEAVQALIEWAFDRQLELSAVTAQTEKSNIASGRVLEKVGMHVYSETDETLCWKIDKK